MPASPQSGPGYEALQTSGSVHLFCWKQWKDLTNKSSFRFIRHFIGFAYLFSHVLLSPDHRSPGHLALNSIRRPTTAPP